MACSKFQGEGREYPADYGAFYQAIESYDIKALIREAASREILSESERSEIERLKTTQLMRDCLIKSILYRGARERQQFTRFVREFSRRAYEQTCKHLAGFQQHVSNITSTESDAGCVHSGKELPQLSQDSSHSSAGSTSPMELDTKPPVESNIQDLVQGLSDDMGYFSISGSGGLSNDPVYTPISYTSTSFMENELKKLQKTRSHRFQRFVSSKQQHSEVPAAVFNFPSASSQITPSTVNNYFVTKNVFNISNTYVNPDFDSHGTEYPGPVTTSHSCAKLSGRYSPVQSTQQPQEKKWEGEWSQCLKEHHCRIIEYLDVNTLLPHLWEKGLLTPNERDTLDSMRMTPREKARYLLRRLQGKGKRGFKLFLECLRDEKYHLGHEDLVKCLNSYSSQNH